VNLHPHVASMCFLNQTGASKNNTLVKIYTYEVYVPLWHLRSKRKASVYISYIVLALECDCIKPFLMMQKPWNSVKWLIWTFRNFCSTRPFSSVYVNKHSYYILTATHNRILQGCLYNQSSILFHVGLGDWLPKVGDQPTTRISGT